jgi:hypothetical protein
LLIPSFSGSVNLGGQTSTLSDAIRNRLEAGRGRGEWTTAEEEILAVRALPQVYLNRGFAEIWFTNGRPSDEASSFVEFLRAGDEGGLRPEGYHLPANAPGTSLQGPELEKCETVSGTVRGGTSWTHSRGPVLPARPRWRT